MKTFAPVQPSFPLDCWNPARSRLNARSRQGRTMLLTLVKKRGMLERIVRCSVEKRAQGMRKRAL